MTYDVVFSADAEQHLVSIYDRIEAASSAATANRYTGEIVAFCQRLSLFPERGSLRSDLGPGMRVIGFRKRVSIAFQVTPGEVLIAGIFYGGFDYVSVLRDQS